MAKEEFAYWKEFELEKIKQVYHQRDCTRAEFGKIIGLPLNLVHAVVTGGKKLPIKLYNNVIKNIDKVPIKDYSLKEKKDIKDRYFYIVEQFVLTGHNIVSCKHYLKYKEIIDELLECCSIKFEYSQSTYSKDTCLLERILE